MKFWGYKRPDGRVGIRNYVLILPASVCASDTTRIIASRLMVLLRSITRMAVPVYRLISSSLWT